MHTARSCGPIGFKVDGLPAKQRYLSWRSGETTASYGLTSASAPDQHIGILSVDWVASSSNGQIEAVFTFDNNSKQWLFYDSHLPEVSDLRQFTPGMPYFFLVTNNFRMYLNGTHRELTCLKGNCWNLIVW